MDFEQNSLHFICHNFSSSEISRFTRDLNQKLADGSLGYDDLFTAICTVDDGSAGCIPESLGTPWFCRHIMDIARIFGQVNLRWFLLDCGTQVGYYFAEFIACHAEVYLAIEDEEWRKAIARELYLRHGARNFGWINAYKKIGLNDKDIAEVFIKYLETVEVKSGMANDIHDFLKYGDKLDDAWQFLVEIPTEDDSTCLEQAFMVCAKQDPEATFDATLKLYRYLSAERIEALRQEIIPLLTSVNFSAVGLANLPMDTRVALLERQVPFTNSILEHRLVAGYTRQLVDTVLAMEFEKEASITFVRLYELVLTNTSPVVVFRNAHETMGAKLNANKQRPGTVTERYKDIDRFLLAKLEAVGVFVGTVEEGRHNGRCQMQVIGEDGTVFVHDKHCHRFYPKVGDRVIIHPKSATRLTTNVWVLTFLPAYTTIDVY